MKPLPLLLLSGCLACGGLRAQEGPLTLIPPLAEDFPMETLADGVHLRYPVLINGHTVLGRDAILHFLYLDPDARTRGADAPGSEGADFHSHVGPGGTLTKSDNGPGGGWSKVQGSEVAGIFDDRRIDGRQRKAELENELWKQSSLFADALEHATELGTILAYSVPPHKVTYTAPFDLPEGMLLGEMDGHVRVLGLREDSRAYVGGVRAGDEIRAFNGSVTIGSLNDFTRAFVEVRHAATVSSSPNYSVTLWRPAVNQVIIVQMAAPPSIPSFLKEDYSAPAARP